MILGRYLIHDLDKKLRLVDPCCTRPLTATTECLNMLIASITMLNLQLRIWHKKKRLNRFTMLLLMNLG